MDYVVGGKYTRASIQDILNIPANKRGGDWATGYTRVGDEVYIFCNVGVPGRTGHDYRNVWDGNELVWSAKTGTEVGQPLIDFVSSHAARVHVFHRSKDRESFTYAGVGRAVDVNPASPVIIRWAFDRAISAGMMIGRDAITQELRRLGFDVSKPGSKTQLVRRNSIELYIKVDSASWVVVINPKYESCITQLQCIKGAHRPLGRFFYHNSTMRCFPKRLAGGSSEIPYGLDFDFSSFDALRRFVDVLDDSAISLEPASCEDGTESPITETEALRAARLGQQRFRADLLEKWCGRCALTGIAIPELLRASHIKRWADSAPNERHDVNNGLLLAIHVDGLFDRGLISFSDDGAILLSSRISRETLDRFGISSDLCIRGLGVANHQYLLEHRRRYGFVER